MPWLCRLRQPTLVLAGDDDPIVPVVNGRILARLIPDATLHVVRGGGHLFVLEDPAAVASKVAEFLLAAGQPRSRLSYSAPRPERCDVVDASSPSRLSMVAQSSFRTVQNR